MGATEADPFASLKAANAARADAWHAEPEEEPEEELVSTFKAVLPPLTVGDRWALAQWLDETATRTVSDPTSPRTADWERALVGVLRDLATAAREAKGRKVASAQEATDVATPVDLRVTVSLNKTGREKLHKVLQAARNRAPDGQVGVAVVAVADQFETFVYGPKGEPHEPPRRSRYEPPGMWEPMGTSPGTSILGRFRR